MGVGLRGGIRKGLTMRRILRARGIPVGMALAAALAIASHGCAGGPGRRAPSPAQWQSRGSTLGSDLLRAPRGISIPPPSLGVDLVKYPGGAIPGAVERAALPVQPE